MLLRRWKIAPRAALGFALIASMVACLGLFSLDKLADTRSDAVTIEDDLLPSIQHIAALRENMLRIRIIGLRLLLDSTPEDFKTLDEQYKARNASLQKDLQDYQKRVDEADEKRLFAQFMADFEQYQQGMNESFRLARANQTQALRQLLLVDLKPVIDRSGKSLAELGAFYDQHIESAGTAANEKYSHSQRVVILVIVLAALFTVLLAWLLTLSIVQPLRAAVETAQHIAQGDLSQRIGVDGQDELSQLQAALAHMQQQLRETLTQIAGSSHQVKSSVEQLNVVARDAGVGVQKQNDEIEQAATAVNEMSAAVEEVARNAVSTSEASKHSSDVAQVGQGRVGETIRSINGLTGRIEDTVTLVQRVADDSQNVGRVLDVIRAIAEQTNLLALNAAIEAARAGDSGRGFAVVADEVRALAQRTQNSTQEIEQMVSSMRTGADQALSAMQASSDGARTTRNLANDAGSALEEILTAIEQMYERNLVIASAAEEQAQVAREIDRNLMNIRDLSALSAQGAQQTSESSQSLSGLAGDLSHLVGRFRL